MKNIILITFLLVTQGITAQITQIVTMKSGKSYTVRFESFEGRVLKGAVSYGYSIMNPIEIPFDSISSVRTLDVNYEYDAFDAFLSNGYKVVSYEKIANKSTNVPNCDLWVSARQIQGNRVLVFKLRTVSESRQYDPQGAIPANSLIGFTLVDGNTISCPILNTYLIVGAANVTNIYNFAYIILSAEDCKTLVNITTTRVTIDKMEFKVEDGQLLKRFVLAINDEYFYK